MPPGVTFDKYMWNTTTLLDPANLTLSPGSTFSHNLSGATIDANSSGEFTLDFTSNLAGSAGQMYRHGRDWSVGLDYVVGNLTCHVDSRGRYGPIVEPTMPALVNGSTFEASAAASDPDPAGSIAQVYFTVLDSAAQVVYARTETSPPYCLAGKTNSVCDPVSSVVWPNGVPIADDATYTITVRARDNDPHPQYTRVLRTLLFDRTLPPNWIYLPLVLK
jgi:hypothetical protein